MNEADHAHLRRAIELAVAARDAGDMPFGSLLVGPRRDVLKEERNTVLTKRDITHHPEMKLARWAARELDRETAAQTTMYASCEPCAMCRGAIARANLGRVVFALSNDQLAELRPPGVSWYPMLPKLTTRDQRCRTRDACRSRVTTDEGGVLAFRLDLVPPLRALLRAETAVPYDAT